MNKITLCKAAMFGFLLLFFTVQAQAQSVDSERMKRDLAVTENVLSTLLGESSDSKIIVGLRARNVEGSYVKDYGVIFTVDNSWGSRIAAPRAFSVYPKGLRMAPDVSGSEIIIGQRSATQKSKKSDQSSKSEEEEKSYEELQEESKADFIEDAKTFLADYAHLISQLGKDDHVMIRMISGSGLRLSWGRNYAVNIITDELAETYSHNNADKEVMVEAKVGDIEALNKGQISRDAFLSKVKVTEVERTNEKKPDLEMIASMFHRLYQRDLSDTYYTLSSIPYSHVKGVGIVYQMRVYSSYESDNVFYMPSTGDQGLNLEERNEKVQKLLPQFEKSFKENLVSYARSIKSLENNELLIFEVELTQCKNCPDFPKMLKFSIKKSALDDLNSGKITESQAVNQVNVEREM